MTINFPEALDTDTEIPRISDNVTEISSESLNAMREAIFAIESAIGTNPQGSTANLVSRLDQAFNADGTIKSSALIAAGLIALPIINSQIGASAAITESKLDLDVATQTLQNQISSNDIDIDALRASINALIVQFTTHTNGTAYKHDAFDVLLDSSYPITTPPLFVDLSAVNVGDALLEMNDTSVDHISSAKVGAHLASNISVVDNFVNFSATNVQTALDNLSELRAIELIAHRDDMHANGYDNWSNSIDGYNISTQILPATVDTSFAATILAGARSVIKFTGQTLASFKIEKADAVIVENTTAAGIYYINDIGPRSPQGIKPELQTDELEITGIFPIDGSVQARIFSKSSLFGIKANGTPTIHQCDIRADSIQFARPNAAKVSSLGISPEFLTTEDLVVEVGINSTTTRTLTVTNLYLDRNGLTVDPITVDSVVERINLVFQNRVDGNAFPAAAYKVGDELMISHNWSGSRNYTLKIKSTGTANFYLGLDESGADIVDTVIYPTSNATMYVGGNEFDDFRELVSDTVSASGSVLTFDTEDPLASGVKQGHLLHVKNHPTDSAANGTYFITEVSSSSVTVSKNAGITTSGNISVEISHDALPLHDLSDNNDDIIIEAGIDSLGRAFYNTRLIYTDTITNLAITDISDNFLAGSYSLGTTIGADSVDLQMYDYASVLSAGRVVTIPINFTGSVKVYSPANIEYITVAISGIVSWNTIDFTVNNHIDEEEYLEVCTAKINGLLLVANIVDKRLFGSVGLDELREDVIQAYVETPIADLRTDGIVSGFDAVEINYQDPSYASDVFGVVFRGGSAYVGGARVSVPTRPLMFPPIAGTFIVGLNSLGDFNLFNESDYTIKQILDGYVGSVALISSVTHDGELTNPLTVSDLRFFINNLDNKIDFILDTTNRMIGHFATSAAAFNYIRECPFNEKSVLRVASSIDTSVQIPSGLDNFEMIIDGRMSSLSCISSCKISGTGTIFRSRPHVDSLVISSSAENLILENLHIGTLNIATVADSRVVVKNCLISGSCIGSDSGNITFDGCVFDSATSTVQGNRLFYTNCEFIDCVPSVLGTYINITGCSIDGSGATALSMIFTNDTLIDGCIFKNITASVSLIKATGSNFRVNVTDCLFDTIVMTGTGKIIEQVSAAYIYTSNCIFTSSTFTSTTAITCSNFNENQLISTTSGTCRVAAAKFTNNLNFPILLKFSVGLNLDRIISGNLFIANTIGYNLDITTDTKCLIENNYFEIGSSYIGILCGAATTEVYIRNNVFSGDATALSGSVGVALENAFFDIHIENNYFHITTAISSTAGVEALTIKDNTLVDTTCINIQISTSFVCTGNIGGYYFNSVDPILSITGAGTISYVIIENNNFDGDTIQISVPLSFSVISNNRAIIDIQSDMTEVIISGNSGELITSSGTPIFTSVILNSNNLRTNTSLLPITWNDSVISANYFKSTSVRFTVPAVTDASVVISNNTFDGYAILNSATLITGVNFSNNSCTGTGAFDKIYTNAGIVNCVISGNSGFGVEVGFGSSNSVISANNGPAYTFKLDGDISNTIFRGNTFLELDLLKKVQSATISNSIFSDNISTSSWGLGPVSPSTSILSFSDNTISGNVIYDFYAFTSSNFTSATVNMLRNTFSDNSIGTFDIFGTNNGVNQAIFEGNSFIGNRLSTININGYADTSSDVEITNTIISSNTFSNIIYFGTKLRISGLLISNNLIKSSASSAAIQVTISPAGTDGYYGNINISGNYIDTAIYAGLDAIKFSSASMTKAVILTNIQISNNYLKEKDINFNLDTGVGGSYLVYNTIVIGNTIRNMSLDCDRDISIEGFIFSNNICTSTTNIDGVKPGLNIDVGTTGVVNIERFVCCDNIAYTTDVTILGQIRIYSTAGTIDRLRQCTIKGNQSLDIFLDNAAASFCNISDNISLDGTLTFGTNFQMVKTIVSQNIFDFIYLAPTANWTFQSKIVFNAANGWVPTSGTFVAGGVAIETLQVWGNTGAAVSGTLTMAGTGNNNTTNANDLTGSGVQVN